MPNKLEFLIPDETRQEQVRWLAEQLEGLTNFTFAAGDPILFVLRDYEECPEECLLTVGLRASDEPMGDLAGCCIFYEDGTVSFTRQASHDYSVRTWAEAVQKILEYLSQQISPSLSEEEKERIDAAIALIHKAKE